MVIIGLSSIVAIALIVTGILVFLALSNNIDLNDYVSIKTEGYEGYGNIDCEIDYAKLASDITGKDMSKYSDKSSMDLSYEEIKDSSSYYVIMSAVKVDTVYPEGKDDGNLSNGDVVKYTITLDHSVAAAYEIDVKNAVIEHKVEKLGASQSFNVLESIFVSFDGYNGFGTAKLMGTGFEKTVGSLKFRQSGDELDRIYYTDADGEENSIRVYIDMKSEGISNGDTVTIKTNADPEVFANYGIILEGLTKDVTVSGLKDSEVFDVTMYFDIETEGIDGNGTANITAKNSETVVGSIIFTTSAEEPNYVYYEDSSNSYNRGSIYVYIDNDSDLSNGDTVSIKTDTPADELSEYGVTLTNLTKEVTVSDLGTYAKKLSEIRESELNELYAACKIDLKNRMYEDWGPVVHDSWDSYEDQDIGNDLGAYKTILTSPKNTTSPDKNTLWLVLSVTLDDNSMDEPTVYYFYYAYKDVVVDSFGFLSIPEDYTPEKSHGFTSYDDMCKEYIKSFNLNVEESK